MSITPKTWILGIAIGLLTVAATCLFALPVTAHNYAAFLASPYYGPPGDGVSQRWTDGHDGIDFVLRFAPVLAATSGSVDRAQWNNPLCHDEDQPNCGGSISGFGLYVRISHNVAGEMNYTYYGHLSVARITMGTINKGEWIGTSGDSGNSTGPHLHFEVRHGCDTGQRPPNGCTVNPDNAGDSGVSLWNDGEWTGVNPAASVPERRFPMPSTYGAELVVDDTPDNTGGFTKGRGTITCPPNICQYWYPVQNGGYTNDYYYSFDNDTTINYWAEWHPNLLAFGNYEVLAWMPCSGDFGSWSAPYYIQHLNGGTSVVVDQLTLSRSAGDTIVCNRWISLGVYLSQSGTSTYVRLTDATGELNVVRSLGADAVKFVRVNVGAFETENFRVNNSPRNSHEWAFSTYAPGYVGTGYMAAIPNDDANIGDQSGPELQYRVTFPSAGTYYVWLRGRGGPTCCTPNTLNDSIWFGLNGGSVNRMAGWENGTVWAWKNRQGYNDPTRITINVPTPGLQTINIWMREATMRIDQVLFTPDSSHTPQ